MKLERTFARGLAAATMAIAVTALPGVAASQGTAEYGTWLAEYGTWKYDCHIDTYSGNHLTAVGGGGRTTDAIHSDAVIVGLFEKFDIVYDYNVFAIRTFDRHYLKAVEGGGRSADAIYTDATVIGPWELFSHGGPIFELLLGKWSQIHTNKGYHLTAVDGGGRTTNVIRTEGYNYGPWENFRIVCPY